MSVWHVTDQDRDAQGRIRLLADLLPPDPEGGNTPPRYRPGRAELAALVGGLLLAVGLIAALNAFLPAPAPRLARPTAQLANTVLANPTTTPTAAPTATVMATATATPEPPTPEPPPTPVPPPPCDPQVNPRFVVQLDVPPYGRVTGWSCESAEEAERNAQALRQSMLATAEAGR